MICVRKNNICDLFPRLYRIGILGVDGINSDRGEEHVMFLIDFKSEITEQFVQITGRESVWNFDVKRTVV